MNGDFPYEGGGRGGWIWVWFAAGPPCGVLSWPADRDVRATGGGLAGGLDGAPRYFRTSRKEKRTATDDSALGEWLMNSYLYADASLVLVFLS